MMRVGLARAIEQNPRWKVCGQADNVVAALTAIEAAKPDLVMTDISLPGRSGLELIKELKARYPEMLILVFSMHDELIYAERVIRAGAKGYLTKGEPPEKLTQAIETILNGGIYLSGKASAQLLESLSGRKGSDQIGMERLTDRELEVFELLGRGYNSERIGEALHIRPKTVDAHRSNLKTKLGAPDSSNLIRLAAIWVAKTENS